MMQDTKISESLLTKLNVEHIGQSSQTVLQKFDAAFIGGVYFMGFTWLWYMGPQQQGFFHPRLTGHFFLENTIQ